MTHLLIETFVAVILLDFHVDLLPARLLATCLTSPFSFTLHV